jgi:hypothetical protein
MLIVMHNRAAANGKPHDDPGHDSRQNREDYM